MGEAQVQATLSTTARAGLRHYRSPCAAPTWLWKPPGRCSPAPAAPPPLHLLSSRGWKHRVLSHLATSHSHLACHPTPGRSSTVRKLVQQKGV